MAYNFDEGEILLIDKPYRWTSFDVVRKLRNALHIKKIGHAGTLDPLATGLLILCTGKMTKRIDDYQAQQKEYTGTLVVGKTTPSIDLETNFDQTFAFDHLTNEAIHQAAVQFVGTISQVPPMHSAVRVNGQRVYQKARKGQSVEIKPRTVHVYAFDVTRTALPEISFRIVCSKGTYIRSIVRDFGAAVGTGAYLEELRRTRIGNFLVSDALSVEEFLASLPPST